MIVDLGTGDGGAALAAASRDPDALVIAVDAVAAPMAEASRRAARPPRKGGTPNVLFLVASVESIDRVLDATADVVTITLPWGSLLRGVLGLDVAVAAAISRLVAPGGRIVALVSVTPRDGVPGVECLDGEAVARVGARLAVVGLCLSSGRPATREELAATRSSWLRRLAADGTRTVWRIELRREDGP